MRNRGWVLLMGALLVGACLAWWWTFVLPTIGRPG
jgi:hypothetical protein